MNELQTSFNAMISPSSSCAALERHVEDGLELRQPLRLPQYDETGECVQSSEACVACSDPIMPFALEGHEKTLHPSSVQISDIKRLDALPGLTRDEAQEQHGRIAVAVDRVGTHTPQTRKIVLEETLDQLCQLGRCLSWTYPLFGQLLASLYSGSAEPLE